MHFNTRTTVTAGRDTCQKDRRKLADNAEVAQGKVELPSVPQMYQAMKEDHVAVRNRFIASKRHLLEVHHFLEPLADSDCELPTQCRDVVPNQHLFGIHLFLGQQDVSGCVNCKQRVVMS